MASLRRFRPGVPDVVFGIVLGLGLIGGRSAFLNDPGTFWHIQLGREIAQSGIVPHSDSFTSTRHGAPWVDQSWAFDLALAAVVDRWGWSGAVAATAIGLAWIYGSLARILCRDGISPLVAGVVGLLAAGIGSIHFFTRPHLVTFGFVLWTLHSCKTYHETGGRSLWQVPILVAVWANLHGGFLAGPLIVATAAFGHAVAGRWDASRRRRVAGFVAAFVLSCLAPLANPYGFGLYRHVIGLLFTSDVTKFIAEYQPSPFGRMEVMVLEGFILALVALPNFSRRRVGRYELAHILVWLHLALGAVRNAPLFALVAAPGLARLLDGVLSASTTPERDRVVGRWSAWPAIMSMAVVLSVAVGTKWGELNPARWPTQALAMLDRQPIQARLFHEQEWGGMIEAECQHRRPAFWDDRFELFGKRAIADYTDALDGGPGWDALDRRERFELVWLIPKHGLALRLEADPGWQVLYRDKVSILFRRGSRAVRDRHVSDSSAK